MEKKSSQQQYILKRLKIQNMFSIENVELNFDKNNNFILIDGENRDNGNNNGSGKSSIIKSILFQLGLIPSNKSFIQQSKKEQKVVLELSNKKTEIKIERSIHKSKRSITNIYINNQLLDTQLQKMQYEKIIYPSLLSPLTKDSFIYTHIFTKDIVDIFEMSDNKIIDFLEVIFDINIFDKYYEHFKEKYNDSLQEIEVKKQFKDKILNDISKFQKEILQIEDKLLNNNTTNEKIQSIQNKIQSLKDNLNNIDIKQIQQNINDNINQYNQIQKEIISSNEKIKTLKKQKSQIQKLSKQQKCPTCFRPFKQQDKDVYQQFILNIDEQYSLLNRQIQQQKIKMNELKNKIQEDRNIIDNQSKIKNNISQLNLQLNYLIKISQQKQTNKIDLLKQLIIKNNNEIDKIDKEIFKMEKTINIYKIIMSMFHSKSVIRQKYIYNNILKNIIVIQNNISNNLLQKNEKIDLFFDKNVVKFGIRRNDDFILLKNLSTGEQSKIKIILILQINILLFKINKNTPFNYFIFDEFLDGVDDTTQMKIINLLSSIFKEIKQKQIITSHRGELKNTTFDLVIKQIKENNISNVEVIEKGE